MPYKSAKQRRFFQMCAHNPGSAKAPCPPRKVLREYARASAEVKRQPRRFR